MVTTEEAQRVDCPDTWCFAMPGHPCSFYGRDFDWEGYLAGRAKPSYPVRATSRPHKVRFEEFTRRKAEPARRVIGCLVCRATWWSSEDVIPHHHRVIRGEGPRGCDTCAYPICEGSLQAPPIIVRPVRDLVAKV